MQKITKKCRGNIFTFFYKAFDQAAKGGDLSPIAPTRRIFLAPAVETPPPLLALSSQVPGKKNHKNARLKFTVYKGEIFSPISKSPP